MPPKQKAQLPAIPPADPKPKKNASPVVKYYLVAYNALSALAWSYILISLTLHLLGVFSSSSAAAAQRPPSASGRLSSFLSSSYLPKLATFSKATNANASKVQQRLLKPLLTRASTAYATVGPETTLVQSLAVLEVLHAALGWVRSPVQTTAAQVASRLFLVWGVCEQFESARVSPLYASMVFAWSLTEVIRYSFYALSLLNIEVYQLLWLRYTSFLVLYPVGAGSEAFVNYATLPRSSPIPTSFIGAWARGQVWSPYDYLRGILFLVWWPGLYVLYTYMLGQRRKVLGKGLGLGKKLGGKPKTN